MVEPLWVVAAGGLGAIAGSFLNAALYRYRTGRSVLRGRSACMHCGTTLRSGDLIPIFSFLFLTGRCRYCKSALSLQYVLVELAALGLGVAVYLKHQEPALFAVAFVAWMALLFIVVYDLKHGIIPWSAAGVVVAAALAHAALLGVLWSALLSGLSLAAPLALISLVSRGRAMGWGDGPLQLGLGILLGFSAGAMGLYIGFLSGALVGIILLIAAKRYTMKSEVPFAPFLVFGAIIAYFFDVSLSSFIPALSALL